MLMIMESYFFDVCLRYERGSCVITRAALVISFGIPRRASLETMGFICTQSSELKLYFDSSLSWPETAGPI